MVSFLWPWGQYEDIKVQHLLGTLGRLKFFFSSSGLTPSVKPFGGLISTFAPIEMLDLG
jgi:hypothetical protein